MLPDLLLRHDFEASEDRCIKKGSDVDPSVLLSNQ